MRLCRVTNFGTGSEMAFYYDDHVVPVANAHQMNHLAMDSRLPMLPSVAGSVIDYLPPNWSKYGILQDLESVAEVMSDSEEMTLSLEDLWLDAPFPMPNKVLCLAGNYAEHVREGGGKPVDKEKTFPFFFMKPPTTTIRGPHAPIALPDFSPEYIDWEVELTVIIGAHVKDIEVEDANDAIAGYTIGLDMSNRKLKLNPDREQQERTAFHEWLCGKWHDGFAPVGPCLVANDGEFDPTNADISLSVNGEVMQSSNTANMVFNVYEIVSYASKIMTLEPGDIIMTGTPSGVGAAKNIYLKSGDEISATIDGIGTLVTPVA